VAFFAFILMPFMYFYYEEKDEDATTRQVNTIYYMASSMSGQDGAILLAWDYPPCPARKISVKTI